jgi:long-chain acyl-CoA synthetase
MTQVTRLFDFPYYQQDKYTSIPDALNTKQGVWIKRLHKNTLNKLMQSQEHYCEWNQKNDKIAVISSSNRTEWNIMDIGILQTNAQNVPIYPTITEDDYEYILNHSEQYIVLYLMQNTSKVNLIKDKVLKEVFSLTLLKVVKLERITSSWGPSNQTDVETSKSLVKPNDLATIIYTSGTGSTKRLCSHNNIVSDIK